MKVFVDYLDKNSELEMVRKMANLNFNYVPKPILDREEISAIKQEINRITISEMLERYIIELIFSTRRPAEYGLKDEARYIQFGVSPRAGLSLYNAAKALAYFDERDYVLPEDIKALVHDVFNHRIILNYEAEADGITTRQVIDTLLKRVAIGR
jgi:MoxR-like ATPase